MIWLLLAGVTMLIYLLGEGLYNHFKKHSDARALHSEVRQNRENFESSRQKN